jgi:hypothetical protein
MRAQKRSVIVHHDNDNNQNMPSLRPKPAVLVPAPQNTDAAILVRSEHLTSETSSSNMKAPMPKEEADRAKPTQKPSYFRETSEYIDGVFREVLDDMNSAAEEERKEHREFMERFRRRSSEE